MAGNDLPFSPVLTQSPNLANPYAVPEGTGSAVATVFGSAFMNTGGAQMVERGGDAAYAAAHGGDQMVPYDKAVALLKQQNYDATGVPKTGWSESAMTAEMMRQQRVQDASLAASRANLSSTTQFVSGLAGGFFDPITLGAGPVLGRTVGLVRAGVAGRAAIGALETGGLMGGEEALQNHMQGHDEDSASWTMLRDVTLSAAPGALLHASFGARRLATPGTDMRGQAGLDIIDKLERSDAAAKVQGVPTDQVISPTGAVGRYQIEPKTARGLGLQGTDAEITEQLKDPAVNKDMGTKLLDQLEKRYGNDPEAIAIAYNAGPARVSRWLAAGRDDRILPRETQDYLARLRGAPYQARVDSGKLALSQLNDDSPVDVRSVSDFPDQYRTNPMRIQDEHDQMMSDMHNQALQDAIPVRDGIFQSRVDKFGQYEEPTPNAPKEQYNQVVADAQDRISGLGPEATQAFKDHMTDETNTSEYGSLKHDEMTKSVQAALSCAAMKGTSYGE